MFIQGALKSSSTTFTMQLGGFNPTTLQYYSSCVYIPTLASTDLRNIKLYGTYVHTMMSFTNWLNIGVEFIMGTDILYCIFDGIRNTNTNWSYNKVLNPVSLRGWQSYTTYEAYFDTNTPLTLYPRNGSPTYRDCTFKMNWPTYFAAISGYIGISYPNTPKFYDCKFEGAYFNSINDLIFNFSAYDGLGGLDFYYSFQGTVTDLDNNLLDGVNIKCYNVNDTEMFDITTASGVIPKTDIKVLHITPTGNGTGPSYYTRTFTNPYRFVLSKDGFETLTVFSEMTQKFDSSITLKTEKKTLMDTNGKLYANLDKANINKKVSLLKV